MFKITHINGVPNQYNQKQFILTDPADVALLPHIHSRGKQNLAEDSTVDEVCAVGSTALVCTDGNVEVYMLTPNDEWVKM